MNTRPEINRNAVTKTIAKLRHLLDDHLTK